MFFTKRAKIVSYLKSAAPAPFHSLLGDWLSGELKRRLEELGYSRIEVHIDWLSDYKCINIQARINGQYADIQIEPEQFSVAVDEDEPDEAREYPLVSAAQFYQII